MEVVLGPAETAKSATNTSGDSSQTMLSDVKDKNEIVPHKTLGRKLSDFNYFKENDIKVYASGRWRERRPKSGWE